MAGLRSFEVKKRFKAYTDSVRAVRAANGGIIEAVHPHVADTNPFTHKGIMASVEKRMRRIVAEASGKEELPPLALGEYKQTESYDATRCYRVSDENSRTVFKVTSTSTVMYFGLGRSGGIARPLSYSVDCSGFMRFFQTLHYLCGLKR